MKMARSRKLDTKILLFFQKKNCSYTIQAAAFIFLSTDIMNGLEYILLNHNWVVTIIMLHTITIPRFKSCLELGGHHTTSKSFKHHCLKEYMPKDVIIGTKKRTKNATTFPDAPRSNKSLKLMKTKVKMANSIGRRIAGCHIYALERPGLSRLLLSNS